MLHELLRRSKLLCTAAAAATAIGCGGGSHVIDRPPDATMQLSANSSTAKTAENVTFTLTANGGSTSITMSRIDFDADGTWDDSRSHSEIQISETYSHTYATPGDYIARAQTLNGSEILTQATFSISIRVNQPPSILEIRLCIQLQIGERCDPTYSTIQLVANNTACLYKDFPVGARVCDS